MVLRVTALQMRPYQIEAVDAAMAAEHDGVRRAAEVLPTGAGKTVIIGGIAKAHHASRGRGQGQRTLVIAHREELVSQNASKIARWSGLRTGILMGDQDQVGREVVSASIQSLVAKRRGRYRFESLRDVGLVVVDEAHHAPADSYLRALHHFGCMGEDGGARAVGLTATMTRADQKALGDVWQDVVYTKPITEMIAEGYLVRPRGLRIRVPDLDLRQVRTSRGDYAEGQLGQAIESSMAPEMIAKAYAEHASGKQGIVFAPTVATAQLYCDALREIGITAELITGETPREERRSHLRRFEDGRVQCLVNCMVLTEGTDLPMAEVIVVGRPTKSRGLFVQMVGRGLRLHPGKDSCLVMDVAGATQRHSLLGDIELFGQERLREPMMDTEADIFDDQGAPPEEYLDLDAATDLDEELAQGPVWLTGPTEAVEVDLFHGSKSLWQRTDGGIWFLAAGMGQGARFIIVQRAARPGAWDVIWMDQQVRGVSGFVATDVDDLSYAMAFAESAVTPQERSSTRKNRSWGRREASPAQRGLAARYGVSWEGRDMGELSAAIDQRKATWRIDPYVPAHARMGAMA